MRLLTFVAILFFSVSAAFADEGMWLFDATPKETVKEKYGFDITDEWLNHVQLSSVRFGRGGSGSFVSSNGLVMTNHHVGARQLAQLSTPDRDLHETGFYAATPDEELPCQGLELNVLISREDVTKRVQSAAKPGLSVSEADKTMKTVMAAIEKESTDKTGLKSEVVTLYQGGAYHLYRYKKYTDVRLVFAPEQDIASFGGDPDNYEYPRFCLDAAFFRAYEDGKPAKQEHFFQWNDAGAQDGELVFVSGHPGRTDRAFTREHLESQRDVFLPFRLAKLYRRESLFRVFGERSSENFRQIRQELDGITNYRKRAIGQLNGLMTPSLLDTVKTTSPQITAAMKKYPSIYPQYDLLELGEAYNCRTFQIARSLVRYAEEMEKPSDQRLREFRDTALDSFRAGLLADTPIYEDVEILKLTDSLMMKREWKNSSVPRAVVESSELVKAESADSPQKLAETLIKGSNVRNIEERQRLLDGGKAAIDDSTDPMIRFAKIVDRDARKIRTLYEEQIEEPLRKSYSELAQKRFVTLGNSIYPDATFTLRLAIGTVKGYNESDGTPVAPITNIAGMWNRAELRGYTSPFDPPQSWKDAQKENRLNPDTPFNFVSTNDIIGGNSGSPILNKNAEVVGLVFDGNIYSLSNNFLYSDEQSRCVSVHSAVISESLRKVYGAAELADELGK